MSTTDPHSYESVIDVAIIGGGPAGAAAARVLAERGHRVSVFARDPDPVRAFTESLPPSACQLLATIGILDAMDDHGFVRSYGNTVWWAEREGVDERFGDGETYGFQVSRPRFDALLLDHAAAAGAVVWRGATVSEVIDRGDELALRVRRRARAVRSRCARDSCSIVPGDPG